MNIVKTANPDNIDSVYEFAYTFCSGMFPSLKLSFVKLKEVSNGTEKECFHGKPMKIT